MLRALSESQMPASVPVLQVVNDTFAPEQADARRQRFLSNTPQKDLSAVVLVRRWGGVPLLVLQPRTRLGLQGHPFYTPWTAEVAASYGTAPTQLALVWSYGFL